MKNEKEKENKIKNEKENKIKNKNDALKSINHDYQQ